MGVFQERYRWPGTREAGHNLQSEGHAGKIEDQRLALSAPGSLRECRQEGTLKHSFKMHNIEKLGVLSFYASNQFFF